MDRVKQFFLGVDRFRLMGLTIGMIAGLIAVLWTAFAEPRIDNKISTRIQPIEDAMAFQVFLTMETLDSATVARATTKYKQFKAQTGGQF